MTDYLWKGPEVTIAAAIYEADGKTLKTGYAVIGPRTLDGISYINLRTDAVLTPPAGISETGDQLSAALIGTWAPAEVTPVETDAQTEATTTAEATPAAETTPAKSAEASTEKATTAQAETTTAAATPTVAAS